MESPPRRCGPRVLRYLAHPPHRDYRPPVASAPVASRYMRFVLSDRRALWLLTAAYVAVNLILLERAAVVNDEGLLVHYTATWAWLGLSRPSSPSINPWR